MKTIQCNWCGERHAQPAQNAKEALDTCLVVSLGTRVAFSRQWLRSTSTFTGWRAFARGTVEAVKHGVATIAWDDRSHIAGEPAPATSRVLATNLVREDRIHLEPA